VKDTDSEHVVRLFQQPSFKDCCGFPKAAVPPGMQGRHKATLAEAAVALIHQKLDSAAQRYHSQVSAAVCAPRKHH
jgi:hypothetical protein